jgi:hypothetical protein
VEKIVQAHSESSDSKNPANYSRHDPARLARLRSLFGDDRALIREKVRYRVSLGLDEIVPGELEAG